MQSYVGQSDATRATIDAEGWLRTGDIGYVDGMGRVPSVNAVGDTVSACVQVRNGVASVPLSPDPGGSFARPVR
jgi:hypothetical protein